MDAGSPCYAATSNICMHALTCRGTGMSRCSLIRLRPMSMNRVDPDLARNIPPAFHEQWYCWLHASESGDYAGGPKRMKYVQTWLKLRHEDQEG